MIAARGYPPAFDLPTPLPRESDIDTTITRQSTRLRRPRRLALLMTVAIAMVSVIGLPAPSSASTGSTAAGMAHEFYTWLNRDRVAAGLVPLRVWSSLASMATDRAGRMAASGVMSHAAAGGSVGTALTRAGLPWLGNGEIIGESSYAWGTPAANNLYGMWKYSSAHHAIMFSASYNYVGAGFVRRSDGTTWASVVFTESPDHTSPTARNGTVSHIGTTVSFTWSGRDVRLQTHTAGLRSFDLQYRVDSGAWRLIRNDTTATSIRLTGRAHGHSYSFRVQSADRRGNLSRWTIAARIWVP
jgi:uncharacterized protein YkwD